MRLSEIVTIASDTFDINQARYAAELKSSPSMPQSIYPNLDLHRSQDDEDLLLGLLTTEGDIASVIRVFLDSDFGWQVIATYTAPGYRGQKLMKFLLVTAVSLLGRVMSDNKQTPEATAFWKSLIKTPHPLKLSAFDLETGKSQPIHGPGAVDPWGGNPQSETIILVAEDMRADYSQKLREYNERLDRKRSETGRTNLWYGRDDDPHNL